MTRRAYSVVVVAGGLGYVVVRVPAGVESLRPMPVVVVAGPYLERDAAESEADRLETERDAALETVGVS